MQVQGAHQAAFYRERLQRQYAFPILENSSRGRTGDVSGGAAPVAGALHAPRLRPLGIVPRAHGCQ